jgi:hypothetical protein
MVHGARGFVPLPVSSGKATLVPVNPKPGKFIVPAEVTRKIDVHFYETLVIQHWRQDCLCGEEFFKLLEARTCVAEA